MMDHAPQALLLTLFAIFLSAKVVGELFEPGAAGGARGGILTGVVLGPYRVF